VATNPFGPAAGSIPAFNFLNGGADGSAPGGLDPQTDAPTTPPAMIPSSGTPALQSGTSFVRDGSTPNPGDDPDAPIKKLRPDSELHRRTISKLDSMFKFGKDAMRRHYGRWNMNEMKVQAYVNCNDYEQVVKEMSGERRGMLPPEPVQVTVPYTYATTHAAATFISQVLLGRRPVFPLMATRGTQADSARHMENAIQSHLDASRGFETLWQFIWDSLIYDCGVIRVGWENRDGPGIRIVNGKREQVTETIFTGNVVSAVDPYALSPDPRVPLHQCNVLGDFMFTQQDMSGTILKDMQRRKSLMFVDEAIGKAKNLQNGRLEDNDQSMRRVRIGEGATWARNPTNVIGFYTIREGTVRLVPKDWGLGASDVSELWKFTWIANGQIMQAEPLGMIHQQHPYQVGEPTSFGHDFMSLSMVDMIGPFQDILSWLVSSRMENVRSSISNQFVADPARVDINDIRSSVIGRVIRMKQAAMGLPIQQAIQQLVVQDVTQGHLTDIQTMRILADTITGVNDNMRGIQNQGGRRSATEARISMQAGGSRLSQLAIRISAQAFSPMANQMILNIQQFMPDKMWVETTGDDNVPISLEMTQDMLVGSFNYQISDGTLPFDKQALLESWKEILMGIAQDPELRSQWDLSKIFRYVAELGGAKNIDSFKKQMPIAAGATADPAADPNAMPIGAAMPAAPMLASNFQG
jgi:hypothetical protein